LLSCSPSISPRSGVEGVGRVDPLLALAPAGWSVANRLADRGLVSLRCPTLRSQEA
jgi:hypothetical protein